jgi:hypothetical protein
MYVPFAVAGLAFWIASLNALKFSTNFSVSNLRRQ